MPGPQPCGRHTVQGQLRKAAGRDIKRRVLHLREASAQTKNYFLFLLAATAPTMLTAAAASAG